MTLYKVLSKPLSADEMVRQMEENGVVEGVVGIELSKVIPLDLEGFLDAVSEKLTGSCSLSGIDYTLVGHDGDTLHLRVIGDASLILADEEGGE